MAWWKALPLATIVFGVHALIVALIPPFLWTGAAIAAGLALIGVVSLTLYRSLGSWWGRLIGLIVWTLFLLGITVRIWAGVFYSELFWLGLLFPFYLLAWLMPALLPKISVILFREQFAPQTRFGKGCLIFFSAIGFSGVFMWTAYVNYALDKGQRHLVYLIGAMMGTVATMAISQILAHQLWLQRPWVSKSTREPGKEAAR
jgi:hypothetical protein